jgi:hypothetical protein
MDPNLDPKLTAYPYPGPKKSDLIRLRSGSATATISASNQSENYPFQADIARGNFFLPVRGIMLVI